MNAPGFENAPHVTAPDDFLSAAFGRPCRSLVLPCDPGLLAIELSALRPAFVWTKVQSRDEPAYDALTGMGFRVAADEVNYERPADAPSPAPHEKDGFTVRKIAVGDAADNTVIVDEIGNLAAANMTTSRFHQDTRFPDAIAAEIKKRWVQNFFAGRRGQELYVATSLDGLIVGFNQVLSTTDHKVIDLICTDASFRRHGVARALVEAMYEPGMLVRVGSQANNIVADVFYKSLGFAPVGTSICLHWHAPDKDYA